MKELLRHFWPTYPITTPMLQAKVGSPSQPLPAIVDTKHVNVVVVVVVVPCWTALFICICIFWNVLRGRVGGGCRRL